jgi:DNA-binding NtrC family response regulator
MKIALVENDELSSEVIVTLLKMWGHECCAFKTVNTGLNAYNNNGSDVLWIDHKFHLKDLPDKIEISETKRSIPVIITSTISKEEFDSEFHFDFNYYFLQKPYQWRKVMNILKEIQKIVNAGS